MCLIRQDRFWILHIPFVHVVEFKFLVRFTLDHHHQPILSSLILFLCKIGEVAYNVIDCFVSIVT